MNTKCRIGYMEICLIGVSGYDRLTKRFLGCFVVGIYFPAIIQVSEMFLVLLKMSEEMDGAKFLSPSISSLDFNIDTPTISYHVHEILNIFKFQSVIQ